MQKDWVDHGDDGEQTDDQELASSLSGLMEEHKCIGTFGQDELINMLSVVASTPKARVKFMALKAVSNRPDLGTCMQPILDAVEEFAAARQQPAPAAASKLPGPAATSPDLQTKPPPQPSKTATPHTDHLPSSSSEPKNPKSQLKKEKKQRKKDAEAAAQHNVADQRQDGEAAASAADEPPLAPVGMQPA